MASPAIAVSLPSTRWRRLAVPAAALAAVVIVGILAGKKAPTWLDAHVQPWVDSVYAWAVKNRQSSFLFTRFLNPIAHVLDSSTKGVLGLLRTLRWPGVLALAAMVGLRTGGRRAALAGALCLAGCGVLGLWDDTLITLSLMIVAVVASLVIGIPLGVWSGLSDRAEAFLRSFLDAAQVMPAYVYLLPAVVLFGIANPPAVVATMIFAIPPAVRLTSHGIRGVPVVSNEVGRSFGSTRRQLLFKVQLPMARPAILLGLNQVIMMAFGVVVIAALVGTGGVGDLVLAGLQKVDVAKAFPAGLAIVFAAVALDRVTTGQRVASVRRRRFALPSGLGRRPERLVLAGLVLVVGAAVVAHLVGVGRGFPSGWTVDVGKPANSVANWLKSNVRKDVPVVGGTGPFSDFLVRHLLTPLRDVLVAAPWGLMVVVFAVIGWLSGGRRLALVCAFCFVALAALRDWDLAMDTLSQVLVAAALSIMIAVPIGIWAGRSDRVEKVLRPVLDFAQVMPSFVYLVPIIFLFNIGRVTGVIASVIYALPPGIRLTSLGLRQVPSPPREAAMSFGATPRQELVKEQLPLALRSIMLGVNQTLLMVLSMVVIAALVGAGALGLETVYGLNKSEIGRGVAGGLSIVVLAVALDRITQAWGNRPTGTGRRHGH